MFRATRAKHDPEYVDGFRLRGREVTRLESFSDAVFAFALTLLVVSLDVPKNFADLVNTMRGFPAFAFCFLLLALIWERHYRFCRRYGLEDGITRFLTCTLLFLVLFYVYPLKFLFNLGMNDMVFGVAANPIQLSVAQIGLTQVIYGLGFAAVYLAMFFLHLHAWRLRDGLELNAVERLETGVSLLRMGVFIGIGLLAAAFASSRRTLFYSGPVYLLLFLLMPAISRTHRRRRARLLAAPSPR